MLSFRTSKAVKTSLHTDEEHKLEFKFVYNRTNDGMIIKVVPYKIEMVGEEENLSIVPGAETHRSLTIEQIDAMISSITIPEIENPLEQFDTIVAEGIKIVIVTEGLWKGVLTLNDFE